MKRNGIVKGRANLDQLTAEVREALRGFALRERTGLLAVLASEIDQHGLRGLCGVLAFCKAAEIIYDLEEEECLPKT